MRKVFVIEQYTFLPVKSRLFLLLTTFYFPV